MLLLPDSFPWMRAWCSRNDTPQNLRWTGEPRKEKWSFTHHSNNGRPIGYHREWTGHPLVVFLDPLGGQHLYSALNGAPASDKSSNRFALRSFTFFYRTLYWSCSSGSIASLRYGNLFAKRKDTVRKYDNLDSQEMASSLLSCGKRVKEKDAVT